MTKQSLTILKILGCDERRKARNLLLKPVLQMKLPVYTLILSFTFGLLGLMLFYVYFEQLYVMMLENTTQGSYLRAAVSLQTSNFIEAASMLLVGYVILIVTVTTIYTHRIIGPTIALKRHIKALKDGLYSHRVHLRKHDELKDMAADLNELAEILEQYKTGRPAEKS